MDDLISRKALREEIESEIYWGIASHGAILEAIDEAPAVNPIPVKIGDTAWAIKRRDGRKFPVSGVVSEMYYTDEMELVIVLRYIKRGKLGKEIFRTEEEVWEAIGGKDNANF